MKLTWSIQEGEEGNPFETGFRDGDGKPIDGLEGIFPIVQVESKTVCQILGTGFFISKIGLLATAKHVLVDSNGELLADLAGIHVSRKNNRVTFREIIKVVLHPVADVAVGFLDDADYQKLNGGRITNKFWRLTGRHPKLGEKIVSIGFPEGKVDNHEKGFQLNFRTLVSEGTYEESLESRDRVFLPGPCIRTTMTIKPGASGGPVGFGDGSVFAINSTGYDGTDISYISPVECLLDLEIENCKVDKGPIREKISLRELATLGLIRVDEIACPPLAKTPPDTKDKNKKIIGAGIIAFFLGLALMVAMLSN